MNFFKKINQEKEKHDLNFIKKIQPMGNIIFEDTYIKKGDGFETCLHIYDLPSKVNSFWLRKISEIEDVITTIDISTTETEEIINKLGESIEEYSSRGHTSRKAKDIFEANKNRNKTEELMDKVTDGEVMKVFRIRIFIAKKTLEDLKETVKKIQTHLNGLQFKNTIYLNELEDDYHSIFNSYTTQKENFITRRKGKDITSLTLGAGYNYHHSSLDDPRGTYYGTTFTGGNLILDIFYRTNIRKSYSGILYGKMRSGKSTFLKKMALTELAKGNKVRCFDASGEFLGISKEFNSKFIALDGSEGMINPLQILKSSYEDKEINKEIIDRLSFQKHLSKLEVFFEYIDPSLNSDDLKELKTILNKFYINLGFIKLEDRNTIYSGITDYNNEDYPIMEDLFNFVEKEYINEVENNINKERIKRLDKLKLVLEDIVVSTSAIFNGKSSFEIEAEEFVVFNIKSLSSYSDTTFNAVVFNVLNILWQEMINNTSMTNQDKITVDDMKYLVLIDEAHRLINSSMSENATTFFENFMREAPKYLSGIWYSFHLIEDTVISSDIKSISMMNKIFKLAQYKIIFSQDISSKDLFKQIFSSEITSSEVEMIPKFKTGECLLSISGYKNIGFKVSLGLEDEKNIIATGGI